MMQLSAPGKADKSLSFPSNTVFRRFIFPEIKAGVHIANKDALFQPCTHCLFCGRAIRQNQMGSMIWAAGKKCSTLFFAEKSSGTNQIIEVSCPVSKMDRPERFNFSHSVFPVSPHGFFRGPRPAQISCGLLCISHYNITTGAAKRPQPFK